MDAGPVVQSPDLPNPPDLGPISPELVLVDPVLAEQARKLLPDPVAPPKRRAPVATEERALPPAPRRLRRTAKTAVLAVLVFAAGAVSGGFLRDRHSAPSGVVLEVQSAASPRTGGAESRVTPHRSNATSAQRRPARSTSRTWATNVLGVAAQVAGHGVNLVWQRPAGSARVVVLRTLGHRSTVVFRGRAASFRDVPPRACTAYRYTIVNYDRRGHRSTGVPTSVVTEGCT